MSETGLAVKTNLHSVANFDLESYLRSRTAAVDRALDGYLKRYSEQSGTIWKAMHYGLFPGGKRIRPILVLAAGEIFHGAAQARSCRLPVLSR